MAGPGLSEQAGPGEAGALPPVGSGGPGVNFQSVGTA